MIHNLQTCMLAENLICVLTTVLFHKRINIHDDRNRSYPACMVSYVTIGDICMYVICNKFLLTLLLDLTFIFFSYIWFMQI